MSVRDYGEPRSYPLEDSETFDDSGYVVIADQGGDNKVHKHDSGTASDYDGTNPVIGVNYASTENQWEDVVFPESGEIDVVSESAGFPVKCEAETYNLGDDVYLSQSNDGHVNKTDTTSARLGRVVEYFDNSGGSVGEKVIVKFDTN